jgi:hypothetical protein
MAIKELLEVDPSLEQQMADEAVPEEDDYEHPYPSLEEELEIAKAALAAFPEAAALRPDELEAAAGRLVEQSRPEHYAGQVKTRLSHDDIWLILALKRDKAEDEATGREYLDSLESMLSDGASRGAFPDGWLEDRKREHMEMLPFSGKIREDFQAFQSKVRGDLIHKGFVEVDEDYWEKRATMESLFREEWEHIEEWRQVKN